MSPRLRTDCSRDASNRAVEIHGLTAERLRVLAARPPTANRSDEIIMFVGYQRVGFYVLHRYETQLKNNKTYFSSAYTGERLRNNNNRCCYLQHNETPQLKPLTTATHHQLSFKKFKNVF